MILISRARCERLHRQYTDEVDRRMEAEKLAAERLSAITRLAALVDDLRDQKPDAPLPQSAPSPADVRLRQQLRLSERARASLDEQRGELVLVNDFLNKQLRELAEGSLA